MILSENFYSPIELQIFNKFLNLNSIITKADQTNLSTAAVNVIACLGSTVKDSATSGAVTVVSSSSNIAPVAGPSTDAAGVSSVAIGTSFGTPTSGRAHFLAFGLFEQNAVPYGPAFASLTRDMSLHLVI